MRRMFRVVVAIILCATGLRRKSGEAVAHALRCILTQEHHYRGEFCRDEIERHCGLIPQISASYSHVAMLSNRLATRR
jgi:hypothetical protein